MTMHYFNSKLTVTSGQRLCHSLSIRIQQDVTLDPQKSPLIWLGCCSQKVDGHSCSDPTSYSLFTLILPNLHQNRPQIDPDSIFGFQLDALYRKEFNGLPCPPLPFRRVSWPAAQLFQNSAPKIKEPFEPELELWVKNTLWTPTVDIKVSTHNPRRLCQRNLLILAGRQQRSWHRLLKSHLHLGRSREPCDNPGSAHGDTLLLRKEEKSLERQIIPKH